MIFTLSNSCVLPLLVAFVCVAYSLCLVSGIPLNLSSEELEVRKRCSKELDDTINRICNGRTQSLAQLYPQSFGQRTKRLSPDEIFYRPLQNGSIHDCCLRSCGYNEIRRYCAP